MNLADMLEDSFDNCFGGGDAPYEALEDMHKLRQGIEIEVVDKNKRCIHTVLYSEHCEACCPTIEDGND